MQFMTYYGQLILLEYFTYFTEEMIYNCHICVAGYYGADNMKTSSIYSGLIYFDEVPVQAKFVFPVYKFYSDIKHKNDTIYYGNGFYLNGDIRIEEVEGLAHKNALLYLAHKKQNELKI